MRNARTGNTDQIIRLGASALVPLDFVNIIAFRLMNLAAVSLAFIAMTISILVDTLIISTVLDAKEVLLD